VRHQAKIRESYRALPTRPADRTNQVRPHRRSGLGVPIDLVYLDLGGTVVELITYEGAAV
jgi:hypothetical protein